MANIAPGLIFAPDDDVAPDVVWISMERLPAVLQADGRLHGAPDLIVEVLSPGAQNTQRDREAKLGLYSRRGVPAYWIIDWQARQVEIYRQEQEGLRLVATLSEGDILQSPLLPGFSCPVRQLFAGLSTGPGVKAAPQMHSPARPAKTRSPDTHPDAERVQLALLRKASLAQRASLALSLSQTTRQLAWRALRRSKPEGSAEEAACTFVALHYGRSLATCLKAALARQALAAKAANHTMSQHAILAALTPVVEALEQLEVRYLIGGSVASSAYGVPRSTLDVDLVAELQPEHVRPLIERLSQAYYIGEGMIRDAMRRRSSFKIIHLGTLIKLDVFIPPEDPSAEEELRRIRREALDNAPNARRFALASPEDVILRKLEWFKAGGEVSERQWHDVLGVLQVQAGSLDMAYLRARAQRLGVAELLERALAEAGPGD